VVLVEPALLSTPPAGLEVTVYPVIAEPPLLAGATKETDAVTSPGVATTEVGAFGTEALEVSVITDGFVKPPLFVGVRIIEPVACGVIVNVCADADPLNVSTVGVRPVLPAPVGVIVIVPVYGLLGVIVKLVVALFTLPVDGPVNVNAVAIKLIDTVALETLEILPTRSFVHRYRVLDPEPLKVNVVGATPTQPASFTNGRVDDSLKKYPVTAKLSVVVSVEIFVINEREFAGNVNEEIVGAVISISTGALLIEEIFPAASLAQA
jgi:hypothetical protein